MNIYITSTSLSSPLGDAKETYRGLLEGKVPVTRLSHPVEVGLTVRTGYQLGSDARTEAWPLVSPHLQQMARGIVAEDLRKTIIVVGTGMHEQRAMEISVFDDLDDRGTGARFPEEVQLRSQDGAAVSVPVMTLSGACSASGTALALAADFLEQHVAECVIVAGVDVMALGMLAMMGRVNPQPADRLTPFDSESAGVLLGEGAAAVTLRANLGSTKPIAEVLSTALSCDAFHETAPDEAGIEDVMRTAHIRAGISPDQVDLVVAHGTGTALNDPAELRVLSRIFSGARPQVTAFKGGTGHTSGASMLISLIVAIEALQRREAPAIAGLTSPREEGAGIQLLEANSPMRVDKISHVAQIEAFGFGGVNAVALVSVTGGNYG